MGMSSTYAWRHQVVRKIFFLIAITFSFVNFLISTNIVYAQNLNNEKIQKIVAKKRAIYLTSGVFHNGEQKNTSSLKALRHSYAKSQGYERIVFDFTTDVIPKIYGYVAIKSGTIYVDLFNTSISEGISAFGKSNYVEKVDFFPVDEKQLSVELKVKQDVSAEVFYLEKPGRLVIDLFSAK